MPLINCDLRQIEVVVLATLSKDPGFIELLNRGTDIYKYFAAIMYDKKEEDVTPEERNSLKVPILGMSYGRGVKALAEETGNTEEWCRGFIDSFYGQFPKVKDLHDRWIKSVGQTGQLKMFSGIYLQFKRYPKMFSEEYGCWFKEGYKSTEIKNYPVQHTAFIILSLFLSAFMRQKALHNRDKYLLINTVHDSIMLDCRPEYVEDAKKDLNEILAKIPDMCYNVYSERLLVTPKAEITVADSWDKL